MDTLPIKGEGQGEGPFFRMDTLPIKGEGQGEGPYLPFHPFTHLPFFQ